MTLETVGGHFLHPARDLHNRRSCTIEVVQYQTPLPGYDRLSVQGRIIQMLQKGNVDIWVRVDYSSTSSQPPLDNVSELFNFNRWLQALASDPNFGKARGFIIGNEPNLTGTPAAWVAECVYGFGTDSGDTNNAYQFITSANPNIMVLAPAVAPWSAATDGDFGMYDGDPGVYAPPPDNRAGLMPWERYQGALAWRCYNNDWHAPYEQIKFALHTYANVAATVAQGQSPATEPLLDLRDPNWLNAHNGSRTFEDMHYQMIWAASGNPPPILLSEWNSYVNGAWPCDNYPDGLLTNLVRQYLTFKPNLMGFASFVDANWAGGCPNWEKTAITGYLDTSGCVNAAQKQRLQLWDGNFDELLRNGWG